MKAKKKAKLDLIDDDTLIVGIDVGKRNHYARFIILKSRISYNYELQIPKYTIK
ncbi:MAG: hypothetical protein ACYDIA_01270 [Candidatus Humimicrobiaceae bacterium]